MAAVDAELPGEQAGPGRGALRLARQEGRPQQHPVGPVAPARHHVDAVVDAVGEIDVETAGFPEESFVLRGPAAAIPVAGRLAL